MTIQSFIIIIEQTLLLLILLKIVLSYFMDPFHPLRQTIDKIIEPLLRPIRQLIPSFGHFDFSPLILMVIIEVLTRVLLNII